MLIFIDAIGLLDSDDGVLLIVVAFPDTFDIDCRFESGEAVVAVGSAGPAPVDVVEPCCAVVAIADELMPKAATCEAAINDWACVANLIID